MSDTTMKTIAPDIGAIVIDTTESRSQRYRVSSWMKEVSPDALKTREGSIQDVLGNILVDSAHKNKNGNLWVWCSRKEATHLSCAGVCGHTLAIENSKVVGKVDWPKELLDSERRGALALVGKYVS